MKNDKQASTARDPSAINAEYTAVCAAIGVKLLAFAANVEQALSTVKRLEAEMDAAMEGMEGER